MNPCETNMMFEKYTAAQKQSYTVTFLVSQLQNFKATLRS